MFSGLTTNLTQSVKITGSMAGGYLKFGANAIAERADKVGRNIQATAINTGLLNNVDDQELNEE